MPTALATVDWTIGDTCSQPVQYLAFQANMLSLSLPWVCQVAHCITNLQILYLNIYYYLVYITLTPIKVKNYQDFLSPIPCYLYDYYISTPWTAIPEILPCQLSFRSFIYHPPLNSMSHLITLFLLLIIGHNYILSAFHILSQLILQNPLQHTLLFTFYRWEQRYFTPEHTVN